MQSNTEYRPDYELPDLRGASATDVVPLARSINSYPEMPDTLVDHIVSNGAPSNHVYTKDLQGGGVAIQDSMETYLGNSGYISSGAVKSILDTPLHFHYQYDAEWKNELKTWQGKQSHFDLGTYLHEAILEPTKFSRCLVEPKQDGEKNPIKKSSKAGYGFLCNWLSTEMVTKGASIADLDAATSHLNPDVMNDLKKKYQILLDVGSASIYGKGYDPTKHRMNIIPEDQWTRIDILETYFKTYGGGVLPHLVKHSKREISLYLEDPDTGLKLRVRPDAMAFEENLGVNAIISIKSTSAQRMDKYFYDACRHEYLMKDAMYLDVASKVTGRDFCTVINIVLQTVAPYCIMLVYYSPEDIEKGMYRYKTALASVKEALEKDHFPGYDAYAGEGNMGMIQFEAPNWYNKELAPITIEA